MNTPRVVTLDPIMSYLHGRMMALMARAKFLRVLDLHKDADVAVNNYIHMRRAFIQMQEGKVTLQ